MSYASSPLRRVVVTGVGMVTPLGAGARVTFDRLLAGETAVRSTVFPGANELPCRVAAAVPRVDSPTKSVPEKDANVQFDVDRWVDKDIRRQVPPFIQFALAATKEALADSGWVPKDEIDRTMAGVAIGGGMGSLDDITQTAEYVKAGQLNKVSPYFIPKILINMASGYVSIKHGLKGPNHAVTTACATGAHALGDAANFIRLGHANIMVAGGTESCINKLAMAGFSRAKALSTKYNDRPSEASRPFDKDRDGFVMGEGAGIMVLEEREYAMKRGARIYAELSGYGLSGDAFHITAPSADGDASYRAMAMAMKFAGLKGEDVDYINAHATSTPLGDAIEAKAIKRLFGAHAGKLAISSNKGAIGHLLGAAGAVEAIVTVMSLHQGIITPTVNLHNADVDGLDFVPREGRKRVIKHALSNSFGFGGTNASLCFSAH